MQSYFAWVKHKYPSILSSFKIGKFWEPSVKEAQCIASKSIEPKPTAQTTLIPSGGRTLNNNLTNLYNTKNPIRFFFGATPVINTSTSPLSLKQLPYLVQVAQFSTSGSLHKRPCPPPITHHRIQGSEGVVKTADECGDFRTKEHERPICPSMPPCLKFVRRPKSKKKIDSATIECGRICMPCCPKARYPPICYLRKEKVECIKTPNPRPAFSDCAKDKVKARAICDCCHYKPPPCRLLPDIDDEC